MSITLELTGVALAALLSENFVLVNCLGIGTRRESFLDPVDALRTGHCLVLVMVVTALFGWALDNLVLQQLGLTYLRTLVFALLAPGVVALLRKAIGVCWPELSRRIDGNLASISSNCAAMGVTLIVSQRGYGLGSALLFAFFGGVGAAVALVSFAALREEVDLNSGPKPFRGIPMELITAGLMALALVGFYGLHLD